MCLISPRYIKKEEEVRTGEILDRTTIIGEEIGCLVENKVIIVIKVMDEVEVILEEVVFEVRTVVILVETIVGIEIEKIGDLVDSPDQEKEEWELDQSQVLDWDQIQELVQIGTDFDVSNVGNMIVLLMNVQI